MSQRIRASMNGCDLTLNPEGRGYYNIDARRSGHEKLSRWPPRGFLTREWRSTTRQLVKRVAVSEHILLGGDNIDLAIAHMVEPRLAGPGGQISGPQWDQLVTSCRNLKEHAFAAIGPPDERFVVGLAGRGSGMVAGSQARRL